MFRQGGAIALSEVIPLLENMGLKVLTEQLSEIKLPEATVYVQDIAVQAATRCAFDIEHVGEEP